MPIFDYRCSDCGKVYDVFHKGKEIAEDISCPMCGSAKYSKLMSAPMVSIGSSGRSDSASGDSCETGGCCGGACGIN